MKRHDIQWFRALAIGGVLWFHLVPEACPQGYLGVDIFFVISGYLMTSILSHQEGLAVFTKEKLIKFYSRRIRRIFPVYYLTLLLTVVACSCFVATFDFPQVQQDTLWSLGFISNWQTWWHETDYFQMLGDYRFLTHTWSLSVEIQYYLIAPFLLPLIAMSPQPLLVTYSLILSSWCLQVYLPSSSLQFSFVLCRLWQFLIGTATFLHECNRSPKKVYNFQFLIGTFLLTSLMLLTLPFFRLPSIAIVLRILATASTGILIYCGYRTTVNLDETPMAVVTSVGDVSYSLYLVHWPVIVAAKYLDVFDKFPVLLFVILIGTLTLLEYRIFETQLPRLAPHLLDILTAILFAVTLLSALTLQGHITNGTTATATDNVPMFASNQQLLAQCRKEINTLNCPSEIHRQPGHPFQCTFRGTGNRTILLIGNSFAMRYAAEFNRTLNPLFKTMNFVGRSGCVTFPKISFSSSCTYTGHVIEALVNRIRPDIVIVGQQMALYQNFTGFVSSVATAVHDPVAVMMAQHFRALANGTKKVVIVEPNYVIKPHELPNLSKMPALDQKLPTVPRAEAIAGVDPGWVRVLAAIKDCAKCTAVETRHLFCNKQECDIFDAKFGNSLFCDKDHFSPVAVHRFVGLISEIVKRV